MKTVTKKIQHTKAGLGESLEKKWESTVMHGQHIRGVGRQLIAEEDTFLWLSMEDLKVETGNKIIAAQDQAYKSNIMQKRY